MIIFNFNLYVKFLCEMINKYHILSMFLYYTFSIFKERALYANGGFRSVGKKQATFGTLWKDNCKEIHKNARTSGSHEWLFSLFSWLPATLGRQMQLEWHLKGPNRPCSPEINKEDENNRKLQLQGYVIANRRTYIIKWESTSSALWLFRRSGWYKLHTLACLNVCRGEKTIVASLQRQLVQNWSKLHCFALRLIQMKTQANTNHVSILLNQQQS